MIIPPWVYLAGGAVALASAGYAGWQMRDWQCDATIAEMREQAQEARDKAQRKADDASVTYEATRAENASQARSAAAEIRTIYRDLPPPPADCAPSPDAVRLLDNAISRAGQDSSEPSGTVSGTASTTGGDARP